MKTYEFWGEVVADPTLSFPVTQLVFPLPIRMCTDLDILLCRVIGEDPVYISGSSSISYGTNPQIANMGLGPVERRYVAVNISIVTERNDVAKLIPQEARLPACLSLKHEFM